MEEFLEWVTGFDTWFESLNSSDLSSALSSMATIALAFFAWKGYSTWKNQLHTQKKLDFIEDLFKAVINFHMEIQTAVSFFGISITNLNSTIKSCGNDDNTGIRKFILKKGAITNELLNKELELSKPYMTEINLLIKKGQLLGIDNFDIIYNECEDLLKWNTLIRSFSMIVGSANLIFDNKEAKALMLNYRQMSASAIRTLLDNHIEVISDFYQEQYKLLLQ